MINVLAMVAPLRRKRPELVSATFIEVDSIRGTRPIYQVAQQGCVFSIEKFAFKASIAPFVFQN